MLKSKDTIISIRDLVSNYGNRQILRGINLDIHRGETIVILGRSGCGKSTLLRHILGISLPTSGQIIIEGYDLAKISEKELLSLRRKCGVLFQNVALINSMTVIENVGLPLRYHTELEDTTIRLLARMKLHYVMLYGFDDFMPEQLSGGMKKRVGLARAMVMDPDILFCDEPIAGLDPRAAAGIDNLLNIVKKNFLTTIVVVTHEVASALMIADRIAMLHEGHLVALGTPEELRLSTNPVIQQFLKREPEEPMIDKEKYLNSLMGE